MNTEGDTAIRTRPILTKNEFKVNENFPNGEKRTAMGLIAIHVDDLLISGSDTFLEYITFRMKEKFEVDAFEENKATYLGMKNRKDRHA